MTRYIRTVVPRLAGFVDGANTEMAVYIQQLDPAPIIKRLDWLYEWFKKPDLTDTSDYNGLARGKRGMPARLKIDRLVEAYKGAELDTVRMVFGDPAFVAVVNSRAHERQALDVALRAGLSLLASIHDRARSDGKPLPTDFPHSHYDEGLQAGYSLALFEAHGLRVKAWNAEQGRRLATAKSKEVTDKWGPQMDRLFKDNPEALGWNAVKIGEHLLGDSEVGSASDIAKRVRKHPEWINAKALREGPRPSLS
jgi:hypothetical protein